MALDKLVDSTQLDAGLTSVADAIRTKGGTTAQMAFPAGFVSAVEAIGTGGQGYSVDAVFHQGDNKIFTTDDLDAVKPYLTVTVTYPDSSTEVLADDAYTLSGTLTAGNSSITVTALRVSTTISVTVTAAVDVTPSLSSPGTTRTTAQYNPANGKLTVFSSSNGTYSQAYFTGFQLEQGLRYRITAHADVTDTRSSVVITFMNPSTDGTIGRTNTLTADGELLYDGIPSESGNYASPARINFYVTWTTSTRGGAVFGDFKIIKYAESAGL